MPKCKKPVTKAKDKAWRWFSRLIRLDGADNDGYCNCYTCGKRMYWHGSGCQAGHGIASRRNSILFIRELVKPQCYRCNMPMGGNTDEFHLKLVKEYGIEQFDKWILKKNTESVSWTVEELNEMAAEFKAEAEAIAKEKGIVI